MKKKKQSHQSLPKWFKGSLYKEGGVVTNPFSKEEYRLTNVELSLYDFIMGSQMIMEVAPKTMTGKQIDEFQKALTWFRQNNPEAYMVLLD